MRRPRDIDRDYIDSKVVCSMELVSAEKSHIHPKLVSTCSSAIGVSVIMKATVDFKKRFYFYPKDRVLP